MGFAGAMVGLTLAATACPASPARMEAVSIDGAPVTVQYCYQEFGQVRLDLTLKTANVVDGGNPVAHVSLSTGAEFDVGIEGAIVDPAGIDSLQHHGCIDVTWTALQTPAEGPLVLAVWNHGFW